MSSFMQEIERDLKELLDEFLNDYAAGESTESREKEIMRWVKERVLESYRNGQSVGQKIVENTKTYDRARKQTRPMTPTSRGNGASRK